MSTTGTIAFVAGEFGAGGLGWYLSDLTSGLASRGWEVHLVVTEHRGERYGSVASVAGWHDLSGVPLSRRKVFALAGLIARLAPRVLLCNHAPLAHYALPLLGRAVLPVAVLHSQDARFYRIASICPRRVFRWVAPTPGVAGRFAAGLDVADRPRARVVAHGIPEGLFAGDHAGGAPSAAGDAPLVVFAGFVAPNKGADLLPGIMGHVWSRVPGARLLVVGDGPLLAELRAAFEREALAGRCSFAGAVPRERAAALLAGAEVLLLPTRIEGFGLVIAEAMLAGAVPVVSRLPGVTDFVVEDGRTGLLVDPDAVEQYGEAVAGLLLDPARCKTLSCAARGEARRRFTAQRMLDDYESLFAEPDDRLRLARRGRLGWWREVAVDLLGRGVDPAWVKRRVAGLFS